MNSNHSLNKNLNSSSHTDKRKIIIHKNNGKKIFVKRKTSSVPHFGQSKESSNGCRANYQLTDNIHGCEWNLSPNCQKSNAKFGFIFCYTGEYPTFDCCLSCLEELCKEGRHIEKNPLKLHRKLMI